jgi:tetratricopeptide (TPR) repeat protein
VAMSERVVRVRCEETKKVGSGYRVAARYVLTARHVVGNAQDCHVRLDGETEYRRSKVVWRGFDNIDIVVLELVDAPPLADRDPIWAACRWVDGECRAAGYPAFLASPDGAEREDFLGRLRPLAGIERGRIHAAGSWAENRDAGRWGGMSGAALFSGGCLIGVVTESLADRLLACSVSKLFDAESFRQTFPEFRFDDTVLWPDSERPAVRQLRPWTKPRTGTVDRPPSELLLAHNEVVPFDDSLRECELARLEVFSVDRGPAMLVFTGPGGAGKTRLMIEWCARMRERGWLAGFVESGHAELVHVTEGETPRLLVVDYPEGRVAEVVALCRRAHAAVASVRLVLLARSKGPWFDELRQEVNGGMVTSACWQELGTLDEVQRRRTYQHARAAFNNAEAIWDEVRPEELERDQLPLFAHMRALLRTYGERHADEQPEQVLACVLDHERKHWRAQLGRLLGCPPSPVMLWDLARVLAAVVLFGGIHGPLGDWLRWLRPELEQREREAFASCIEALYRRGTLVMSLQPDLLGEQLVLEAISHAAEHDGTSGVEWWLGLPIDERAPKGSAGQMLTVLTRLVDRNVEAARGWLRMFVGPRCETWTRACVKLREQADPRGHELAAAVRAVDDVELASHLEEVVPRTSVELLQLSVELTQVMLKHAPQDASHDSRVRRARLLNDLASSLLVAGQPEAALAKTREAVAQYQGLARVWPVYQQDLATALYNLGTASYSMGQFEAAVVATRQCVEIRRYLTRFSPDEFLPKLAKALRNLGAMLTRLGHRAEAMARTQEAVKYLRHLMKGKPDEFRPELARTLDNLGVDMSELGRHAEAMPVIRESVGHLRQLTEADRDAFLPDLARALSNLGATLSELSQQAEALEVAQEAVAQCRELANASREAFQPQLARSLATLGMVQRRSGAHMDSLASLAEGLRVLLPHYRRYHSAHRQLFTTIIQLLRATCEAGGLPVPSDLREWLDQPDERE